jgi:hypothetical protein
MSNNVLVIQVPGVMLQHNNCVSVLVVAHRKLQEEKVALVNLIMEKFVTIFAIFKGSFWGFKIEFTANPPDEVIENSISVQSAKGPFGFYIRV